MTKWVCIEPERWAVGASIHHLSWTYNLYKDERVLFSIRRI